MLTYAPKRVKLPLALGLFAGMREGDAWVPRFGDATLETGLETEKKQGRPRDAAAPLMGIRGAARSWSVDPCAPSPQPAVGSNTGSLGRRSPWC